VKLNKQHQSRWNAAVKLFQGLISSAKIHNAQIMFDGLIITPNQIKITDRTIEIVQDNCTFLMFIADPDIDNGLYDKHGDYAKGIRKQIQLVKIIPF
jgi:hypothetical protein